MITSVQYDAQIEHRTMDVGELVRKLKHQWKLIREYCEQQFQKRQQFLEERLTEATKSDDKKKAEAIKQIMIAERKRWRFQRIKKALG